MTTLPGDLTDLAARVLEACRRRGVMLATAESCTGGLVAGCLTAVAGSSDVVERGFVTYTNTAKSEMLGVDPELIGRVGAVSEEVARAMAEGALARSRAQITVAITGVAGPGQSEAKPAGLVYIAGAAQGLSTECLELRLAGDRDAVRRSSVVEALNLALWLAAEKNPRRQG